MLGVDTCQWHGVGLAVYLVAMMAIAYGTLWLDRNWKRLYCMFASIIL
jgi:hypothetical protein